MIAPSYSHCPLCGRMHWLPDSRSMDPKEMGCDDATKHQEWIDSQMFDDDSPDDQAELDFDCGMMDDGLCGYAGSEWCDFECPYRNKGK